MADFYQFIEKIYTSSYGEIFKTKVYTNKRGGDQIGILKCTADMPDLEKHLTSSHIENNTDYKEGKL